MDAHPGPSRDSEPETSAAQEPQLGRGMIDKQVQSIPNGAIVVNAALSDADVSDVANAPCVETGWFETEYWLAQGLAAARTGGRGGVVFVETPLGPCVLRHYRRGGLAALVSTDHYLWSGARRTRSFREFDLLMRMTEAGLPVPEPIAARYVRDGIGYRADLLVRRLSPVRTLAERQAAGSLDAALAERVGRTLARFHRVGVWHADLNAHNVLAANGVAGGLTSDQVWLIDFDRGRLRKPALAWQQSNFARLRRSFIKLGAGRNIEDFDSAFWHPLLAAYHAALGAGAIIRPDHGAEL